jgi:hypothetical protein
MAVKMTLVALNVPHTVIPVDFMKGEHRTDEYAQVFLNTYKPYSELLNNFHVSLLEKSTKRDSSVRRRWVLPQREVNKNNTKL